MHDKDDPYVTDPKKQQAEKHPADGGRKLALIQSHICFYSIHICHYMI